MDRETIERRIAESEKTMEICKLCGNERGYNMAAARINSLRKQLSGEESEVIEERSEETGKESDEQMIGYCKFCGQSVMLPDDVTAVDLTELATERCKCGQAATYRWKKRVQESFQQDIELVFKDNEGMKELFALAGEMIVDGEIGQISVKQTPEKVLTLKPKGSGLCIQVTEKRRTENISYG